VGDADLVAGEEHDPLGARLDLQKLCLAKNMAPWNICMLSAWGAMEDPPMSGNGREIAKGNRMKWRLGGGRVGMERSRAREVHARPVHPALAAASQWFWKRNARPTGFFLRDCQGERHMRCGGGSRFYTIFFLCHGW
jgi:hypothetical protein